MSDTKLLPCPFCGGEAKIIRGDENSEPDIGMVRCGNCPTGTMILDTEIAIRAWNTRTESAEIERLRAECFELHKQAIMLPVARHSNDNAVIRISQLEAELAKRDEFIKSLRFKSTRTVDQMLRNYAAQQGKEKV